MMKLFITTTYVQWYIQPIEATLYTSSARSRPVAPPLTQRQITHVRAAVDYRLIERRIYRRSNAHAFWVI